MSNNQIQEISKLLAELFSQGFKPEFEKFLADKSIPFADQTDLYIRRLFNSVLNIPNVEIISYNFNGSDITVKLSGPFKSYANVNGKDVIFNEDGIATVSIKNAIVSPQDGLFLNLIIQSTPYKSEKDVSLTFEPFSEEENIGNKVYDLAYEQEDRLYKFLVSKKLYNDLTTRILRAEFTEDKIIIKNTAPFDVYVNNHKFEKNSKQELPFSIENLAKSFLNGYMYNWENKPGEGFNIPTGEFDSEIADKLYNTLNRSQNYDQGGIYFDKNTVLDGNTENKNLSRTLTFNGDKPIKFYVVNNYGTSTMLSSAGEITKTDLKDIVSINQNSMYIRFTDSTGKEYVSTGASDNGIIIFNIGE